MNVPAKECQIWWVPTRWSSFLPLPFGSFFKWSSSVCDFRSQPNRCQEQNWQAPEDQRKFCHRAIMHMVSWILLFCSIHLGWPFAPFCSLSSSLQTFQQLVLAVSDCLDGCIVTVAASLLLFHLVCFVACFLSTSWTWKQENFSRVIHFRGCHGKHRNKHVIVIHGIVQLHYDANGCFHT